MVYVSGQPIPAGCRWWRAGDGIRTQAAAAQDRAGTISWFGSSRAGHKVAAVKLREVFSAMRVGLNTAELIAFHCLNSPRKPSFCD
jgi:hypothetical protein